MDQSLFQAVRHGADETAATESGRMDTRETPGSSYQSSSE